MRKPERKKIKNKGELSAKSGFRPKRELPKKIVVEFSFTTPDGVVHHPPEARLKIMENGGVSCLILSDEGKWVKVKGKLDFIKMKTVTIKKDKN